MQIANPAGAFMQGQQYAQEMRQMQRQNALADLFKKQGAGIAAGDQGAINALAQLDPMAARDITRQNASDTRADAEFGMKRESHQMGMQLDRARMQQIHEQSKLEAQRMAMEMDAQAAAEEARQIDGALSAGLAAHQQGPDAFGAFAQQYGQMAAEAGVPPEALTYENFPYIASMLIGARDGIKAGASMAGEFRERGSGVTVNVGSEVGTIPQGYELVTDPQTGARSMRPIPGGPEDTTQFDQAKQSQQAQQAGIVRQTVADLRETLTKASQGGRSAFDLPEVGIVGNAMAQMGVNQEAVDVGQKLATLQSSIAFDRLQKMREASPTGGALGAVSERELLLLQSSVGALAQITSAPELLKTLDTIDRIMAKFEAYPDDAKAASGAGVQPETGAQIPDFSAMSDEELEAWINANGG